MKSILCYLDLLSNHFEFVTIGSGDGGVADWTVVNECITVGAVMSTHPTIDACSESGLGNIEGVGDFDVQQVTKPFQCCKALDHIAYNS